MYLDHFGLKRPPFKITPDTSLFYEGSQRGAALGALIFAIKSGEGIIKVVGEVGSGKTMLCRMLEVKLNDEVDIVYIANPSLSPDNILHVIAHELNLDVTSETNKLDVMQKLQEYLLEKHANNRQVVLFVEEAQSMPIETLEEIRLLSNLETDQFKLLQMVLFGQPELDEKLSQQQIRQLKERITHSFYLDPFPPSDIHEYLNFRMRAVGYKGPDLFDRKAATIVEKYSNGLTRRINILADKSLLASYSEGRHQVDSKHVKTAAKDSDFIRIDGHNKWLIGTLIACFLVFVLWLGSILPGLLPAAGWFAGNADTESKPVAEQKSVATQSDDGSVAQTKTVSDEVFSPSENVVRGQTEDALVTKKQAAEPIAENAKPVDVIQGDIQSVKSDLRSENASATYNSLLDERLNKTKLWFETVDDKHYSIQLFLSGLQSKNAIEEFLENLPEIMDFEQVFIYETKINNYHMYSVNYGEYASFRKTLSVLESIKENFESKPFIRPVGDMRYGYETAQN